MKRNPLEKWPLLAEAARQFNLTQIRRGLQYYHNGGKHTAGAWRDAVEGS